MSKPANPPSTRDSVLAQLRGWAALRTLHPASIDLERVRRVRESSHEDLATPEQVARLVRDLGLNDEGVSEFPEHLRAHFGGLRIWQYPEQFGPYLHRVGQMGVRSYLEIGIRHGGSFVATVEYLSRWSPLRAAVGVDVIPAPGLAAYAAERSEVEFAWLDSRSEAFQALLEARGPFDLTFIDSHHEEAQCRMEVELLARHSRMLALHDITNIGWPGVGEVWRELASSPRWECLEFVEQYAGLGPFMGIGLAIRRGA